MSLDHTIYSSCSRCYSCRKRNSYLVFHCTEAGFLFYNGCFVFRFYEKVQHTYHMLAVESLDQAKNVRHSKDSMAKLCLMYGNEGIT